MTASKQPCRHEEWPSNPQDCNAIRRFEDVACPWCEIERLRFELSCWSKEEAEIVRLRAALERVVKTSEHYSLGAMYSGERHLDAVRTARNALAGVQPDETSNGTPK